MRNLRTLAVVCVAVSMLSSCDTIVKTPDGLVPASNLAQAQKYVGTYSGTFNKAPLNLTIALDGAKVSITTDRDLIGIGCGSSVGALEDVHVDGDSSSPDLTGADLALDAGSCATPAIGDTLTLSFKQDGDSMILDLVYVDETQADQHSPFPPVPPCYSDPQGCPPPSYQPIYVMGELKKL